MSRPSVLASSALALTLTACAGTRLLLCGFDLDTVGAVPGGWEQAETNGRGSPGTWRVAETGGRRFVQLAATRNRGQTFNLLLAPGRYQADIAVAVSLRADAGDEDRGGGVVWRGADADNYYIARFNPLENNLRAYKVVGGVRTQLASVDLVLDPGWHPLAVRMVGPRAEVLLGGRVLQFEDTTFTAGGRVGLWTKADAATSFDDFSVCRG